MLKVINGGGGKSPPKGPEPPFKEHHLGKYLWQALNAKKKPATSLEEIVERVARLYPGPNPSKARVASALCHVRDFPYEYGWTCPHVQKGNGELRKYVPVLVDPDDPDIIICDHLDALRAGITSSAKTMATMAAHEGISLEIMAADPGLDRNQKRQIRSISTIFVTAQEMLEKALRLVG